MISTKVALKGTTSMMALLAALAHAEAQTPPRPASAPAQSGTTDLQTIEVESGTGTSRTDLSPSTAARPASTHVMKKQAIERLPIMTYGDLFRRAPGMNVSNYDQGIVGYGLTIRGFSDGNHGRDIAYSIDDVPVNEVSSQHTSSYADLNHLIPETIERIEITRGPFSVEHGDANLGGSVNIITKKSEDSASATIAGGSQGTVRAVATYSQTSGGIIPFIALEGYHANGHAKNSDVSKFNAFAKGTTEFSNGGELSLRAQVYKGEGGAPGYISRSQLQAGLISEKAATNMSDGSEKFMQNLVVNYRIGAPGEEFSATAFLNHDTFTRWSDFGSGQAAAHDERTNTGAKVKKLFTTSFANMPVQFMIGAEWRTDFIEGDRAPSIGRVISGARTRDLSITQHNLAPFAQVQIKPFEWMKLTGGARYDYIFYDVTNHLNAALSPSATAHALSPKAGIAVTPFKWLEFFANYGEGFRSPSAVADIAQLDQTKPTKIRSKEVGARFTFERVSLSASLWSAHNSNESYQAAPGLPTSSLGRSRKSGVDIEGRYVAWRDDPGSVAVFANFSPVQSVLLDVGASKYVRSTPQYIANVGLDATRILGNGDVISGSAYMTFVGKKYLTQDGALTTKPYTKVAAKAAYKWKNGWEAFGLAAWYPGDRYSEAAFNFGNPIGATPASIFVRPVPRLTLMAGATCRFSTGGL